MHFWIARTAIQKSRQHQRRPVRLLRQRQIRTLRAALQLRQQRLPRLSCAPIRHHHPAAITSRHPLREAPDLILRNPQHLRHIPYRSPCPERRKSTHHRTMPRAIFFEQQINHVILPVMREIHIDIRQLLQRHPVLIQEPLEIQLKPDRTHPADPQTITNQRIRRTAPRDPIDPHLPAILQQIPHDQKIVLIPHLLNDRQLLLCLRLMPPRLQPVAPAQPLHHQLPQKHPPPAPVRRMPRRELRRPKRKRKLTPVRQLPTAA